MAVDGKVGMMSLVLFPLMTISSKTASSTAYTCEETTSRLKLQIHLKVNPLNMNDFNMKTPIAHQSGVHRQQMKTMADQCSAINSVEVQSAGGPREGNGGAVAAAI
jgi:hypothetical protein